MRRLARRLFTVTAAASLVVCVGLLALWADAVVTKRPRLVFVASPVRAMLGTGDDVIFVYYWGSAPAVAPSLKPGTFLDRELPGLRLRTVYGREQSYFLWVAPPLGVTLAALLPACWAAAFVWRSRAARSARLSQGLCPACGYDLRGSPGRCPECGMTVAAPPQD